jgi:arylsulfatase A-like enzyme
MDRFASDDLIMVVSDHGFEAGVMLAILTGRHETDAARDGVIFARGRGIAAGDSANSVTVNDVTPTILAWLGLPIANDMDGKQAAFLQLPENETIATYDTNPIRRLDHASPGAEQQILEELRALGYLE